MIAACPPNERLKSLTLGQLSEEQSDALLLHVQECESCQIELGSIDESGDTLVNQIRASSAKVDDGMESENGCRVAVTRALAALAMTEAKTTISENRKPRIPSTIGEYNIVRPLGHGGMGHVYLGQHTKLGRPVAIKLIADHRRWDQSMHERFASEMKLVGGLNHPNIVVAHDAREVDGLAVLVTEFIDGMTVSEILKRQGALSKEQACSIAGEVAKALAYIDSKGLVHRDIKPSNIMIAKDGTVKVLDLGLARLQSTDAEPGNFTATGQAMGTADYVAPEQVNDGRNVDIRADIYGLGCTLYKMLCGRAPFDGPEYASAFAKMNAHVSATPDSIGLLQSGLPKQLVGLVDRMLEKDASNRPQTAEEVGTELSKLALKADLEKLVSDSRVLSRRESKPSRPAKTEQKETKPSFWRRYPWAAAILVGMAAFAFGIYLGIVVTVKRQDGTTASVEIPQGSTAVVDAEGNIEITLAGSGKKLSLPSSNVSLPDSKPAPVRTDPDNIAYKGNGIFSLDPSSSLYGRVEQGDLIDILLTKDELGIDLDTFEMLEPRVTVKKTNKESTEFQLDLKRLDPLLGTRNPSDFQFEFHDPALSTALDRQKFKGVWKVVFIRHNGDLVPESENHLVVFSLDEAVILGDEEYTQVQYELSDQTAQKVTFFNKSAIGKQVKEEGIYRFHESGRLEFSTGIKPGPGGGYREFMHVMRLEKLAAPNNQREKLAFEIANSASKSRTKLEFYVANRVADDVHGFDIVRDPRTSLRAELNGKPILAAAEMTDAKSIPTDTAGEFAVELQLTPEAAKRLRIATSKNKGKLLAILIDGKAHSITKITNSIESKTVGIYGFNYADATRIAESLSPSMTIPTSLKRSWPQVRADSRLKLLNLCLSMHNYESAHRAFPTSVMQDQKKGIQPHSWRVAVLPFLEGGPELYDQYKFNEPWDSENNLKVLNQMPDVFRRPGADPNSHFTSYVGIADKDAILGTNTAHRFSDITDGSSNTIMLVELETEIPWTKPEDIPLDYFSKERIAKWDFCDPECLNVVFGDCSAYHLSKDALTYETLQKLMLRNDGHVVDVDQLQRDLGNSSLHSK